MNLKASTDKTLAILMGDGSDTGPFPSIKSSGAVAEESLFARAKRGRLTD